jgi:hypothetical protein
MVPRSMHRAAAALALAACLLALVLPAAAHSSSAGEDERRTGRVLLEQSGAASPPQHAFDFTDALLHDAGAAASSWAVSALPDGGALSQAGLTLDGASRGVVLTPSAPLVEAALTISLTGSYSAAGGNLTRTVFNLGGVAFRVAPFAIDVGVRVHSFADFVNANGASVRCSQGFYLTSDLAGHASWPADTEATLTFTVDAHGMVGVPSIGGEPFEVIDFHAHDPLSGTPRREEVPWVAGCQAVSLGAGSALYVGNGGAERSDADFKGVIKSLSVDYVPPPPADTQLVVTLRGVPYPQGWGDVVVTEASSGAQRYNTALSGGPTFIRGWGFVTMQRATGAVVRRVRPLRVRGGAVCCVPARRTHTTIGSVLTAALAACAAFVAVACVLPSTDVLGHVGACPPPPPRSPPGCFVHARVAFLASSALVHFACARSHTCATPSSRAAALVLHAPPRARAPPARRAGARCAPPTRGRSSTRPCAPTR